MSIESAILSLPSVRMFIEDIVNTLGTDSVVVLIPETVSRDMVARLINNRLEVLQLSVRNVPYALDSGPVMSISKTLDVAWPTPTTTRSVRNLLTHIESYQVIHIRDFNTTFSVDPVQRRQWTDLVLDWVRERNEIELGGRRVSGLRLCVVAKLKDFDFAPPVEEVGLSTLWWYGFPSSLEVRLACRIADQNSDTEVHKRRWREQVLPALASGDVYLTEYLWDAILGCNEDIMGRLVDYALKEGLSDCSDWAAHAVNREALGSETLNDVRNPSHAVLELWGRGGLVHTPEYGSEVHPALLALSEHKTDVEHRLWRGQAEFLLPILNEIRIRVCDDMTERFGPEWPIKPSPPLTGYEFEAVRDNPRGVELGHIEYLLQKISTFEERIELLPIVTASRILRNEIAHYRPVSFADFNALWNMWKEFVSRAEQYRITRTQVSGKNVTL